MTLSEAVTAENLHYNNSGIRPPETVIAGRFAYYPILMITYFCCNTKALFRNAIEGFVAEGPEDQVPKREPSLQESKGFTCGDGQRPSGRQDARSRQDRSNGCGATAPSHYTPRRTPGGRRQNR